MQGTEHFKTWLHNIIYMLSPDAGIVSRLLAGCTTGAMAVTFAQPTDVVKVRFQAQMRLADGAKRYNGTMDAYKTIARDEGIKGLWKGKPSWTLTYCLKWESLVS